MTIGFQGAWPALITPSAPDGGVNTWALRDLTEYLIGKEVDGFYLCGATGEGIWLSLEERRQVVEEVLDQVKGRVPTIVHVGCVATRDAVALAKHARQVGAAGISSILPPLARGPESIYLHYQAIAAAVPELPFLPYLYGGTVDALTLMSALVERIPNLAGSKYTGPNMYELGHLVELAQDRWTIFSGMDEQCIFAAMFGAQGNIGSTLNLMPGVYREIRKSYRDGDLARAQDLQIRANRVTRVLISFGFAGALREAMSLLGFDCGQPRLPNPPLPPEKRQALREELMGADFAALTAI